jgi:hypothetical protein
VASACSSVRKLLISGVVNAFIPLL